MHSLLAKPRLGLGTGHLAELRQIVLSLVRVFDASRMFHSWGVQGKVPGPAASAVSGNLSEMQAHEYIQTSHGLAVPVLTSPPVDSTGI